MIKKRLSLSLIALIGSVLLFIVASFAWFAVSEIVNIGNGTVQIINIDVNAELYVSDDGVEYVSASNIELTNSLPGDIKYYKVIVTNNNDFSIHTRLTLHGLTDYYTDIGGDTSNYYAGRSLMEVTLLNASNSIDSVTLVDQPMDTLVIASSFIITHEDVLVPASGTAECYFSFTISESAGNDYQNLRFDIDNLYVQSVQ